MPAAWYMLALSTGATAAGSSDGRQEIDSAGIKRGSQSDSDGRRATATASSGSAKGGQQSGSDGKAPAGTRFVLDYGPAATSSNRQQHQHFGNDRRVSSVTQAPHETAISSTYQQELSGKLAARHRLLVGPLLAATVAVTERGNTRQVGGMAKVPHGTAVGSNYQQQHSGKSAAWQTFLMRPPSTAAIGGTRLTASASKGSRATARACQ
ncbi:hypothetical protein PR003_g21228 [Phytophthora rubi]|uniref:RxLR effector protein n=1 Tax=Phytophthora rubi TaxID=129364 RepID=A0A6A4DJH3_9STRA|nr:hypothetical protein PR003_g21228 [Phytophthora rubi]